MARADSFEDLLQKLLEQGCIRWWRSIDCEAWYSPKVYVTGLGQLEFHCGVRGAMLGMTPDQAPVVLATTGKYEVQWRWYAQLLLDGKFDREA
jgi:hypothetical protein